MARSEAVNYSCDVCGKREQAQRVPHPDNRGWNYVRPDGWGNVFAKVQSGEEQVTLKKDFCSEDCLIEAISDLREEAYGEE